MTELSALAAQIREARGWYPEIHIVVNGRQLTQAQASTVRIAVTSFLFELADPDFMQLLGPIGPTYRDRLVEIERIMGLRE